MSDRDEWRSEVAAMNESDRFQACGHTVRVNGTCYDCHEGPND